MAADFAATRARAPNSPPRAASPAGAGWAEDTAVVTAPGLGAGRGSGGAVMPGDGVFCNHLQRLLDRGPIAEYPRWRTLAEQGHWLYDTAYQRVRVTLDAGAFRVWVPAEEP